MKAHALNTNGNTMFGPYWISTYDAFLAINYNSPTELLFYDEQGIFHYLKPHHAESYRWDSYLGDGERIVARDLLNGSHIVAREDGSGWYFGSSTGLLEKVETSVFNDPAVGDYITVNRDGSGRVSSVAAPNGASLVFTYGYGSNTSACTQINYTFGSTNQPVMNYYYTGSGADTRLVLTRQGGQTESPGIEYIYHDTYTECIEEIHTWWDSTRYTPRLRWEWAPSSYFNRVLREQIWDLDTSAWVTRFDIAGTEYQPKTYLGNAGTGVPYSETFVTSLRDATGITYFDLPTDTHYPSSFVQTADPAGRRVPTATGVPSSNPSITNWLTEYTYDAIPLDGWGNPTVEIYHANRVRSITRNTAFSAPGTPSASITTSYTYDSLFGNFVSVITDSGSNTITYDYYDYIADSSASYAWGKLKSSSNALGSTHYEYYDSSSGAKMGFIKKSTVKNPSGTTVSTLEFDYDGSGRLTEIEDQDGFTITYAYTDWGKPYEVTTYNPVTMVSDTVTYYYTHAADSPPMGQEFYPPRVWKIEDDDARTVEYEYDSWGNAVSVTDPLSNPTDFEYDDFARLVGITDALSGTQSFTYDVHGSVIEFADELSRNTHYGYDVFGRINSVKDHAMKEVQAFYYGDISGACDCGSGAGLVASTIDALGNSTYYIYNLRGFIEDVYVQEGAGSAVLAAHFEYNDLGRLVSVDDHRLVSGSTDVGSATFEYEYDAIGRLTAIVYPTGRRVEVERDAEGVVTRLKGPYGHVTGIEYDSNFMVDYVDNSFGDTLDFTYNSDRSLQKITRPNGLKTEFTYDSNDDLDYVTHYTAGPWNLHAKYDFTWDDAGMITRVDGLNGAYWEYQYDDNYRMDYAVKRGYGGSVVRTETYVQDAAVNRTSRTINGSTVTYGHNHLHQVTGSTAGAGRTFLYDHAGNLYRKSNYGSPYWEATYRPGDDRMVSVTYNSQTTEFGYTYNGTRFLRKAPSGAVRLFYGGIEEEFDNGELGKLDNRVFFPDDEANASPTSNGWAIASGSGTLAYATDALRGKVLHWDRTSGTIILGEGPTANPNDVSWSGAPEHSGDNNEHATLWVKNLDTGNAPTLTFYFESSLGAGFTELRYHFSSGTNAIDGSNSKAGHFYLGDSWRTTTDWQFLQLDFESDLQSLWPSATLSTIEGMSVDAAEVLLDDIQVAPARRVVVEHVSGRFTPGAASWPSGGLAHDTAVYDFFDHLGNAGGRTNASGSVIGSWDVDMYGNVVSTSGSVAAADYRHTGNSWDGHAGLFYFNARWYDPETGRFTQRHTPYQPLMEHPYEISEGNPASFVDPTGRLPVLVLVPLLGGGIGAASGGLVDGAFAFYRSGGDWGLAMRCAGQGAVMGGVSGAIGSSLGLVSPLLGAAGGALSGGAMESLFGGDFAAGMLMGGLGGAGRSVAAKARAEALEGAGMDIGAKISRSNFLQALGAASGSPFAIGMDAWSAVMSGAVGSVAIGLDGGC